MARRAERAGGRVTGPTGVDVARMQRRAGHDDLNTTMRYTKAAEDFTGTVGEPFPKLPQGVVWPNLWPNPEPVLNDSADVTVEALGLALSCNPPAGPARPSGADYRKGDDQRDGETRMRFSEVEALGIEAKGLDATSKNLDESRRHDSRHGADATRNRADAEPIGPGFGPAASPRAALIASLADHVRALALAGDLEAARVASDALARLLTGKEGDTAPIVDLARARERREP
jgi:hypothetical protein